MIYCVLLVYSKEYYKKTLSEFEKLVKSLEVDDYKIIIVNNNPDLLFKFDILGNNDGLEFSGWDSAVSFIRKKYVFKNDYIIFANDTFCQHRKWGIYQKYKFSHAFNNFIQSKLSGLCGEKNKISESFRISDIEIDGWISTYLFIISSDLLDNYNLRFDTVTGAESEFYSYVTETGVQFNPDFDLNLAQHLNNWLFPLDPSKGWYKSRHAPLSVKENKLKSILNEKKLTANVLYNGGKVVDINSFFIPKVINFLKKLFGR